MIKIFLDGGSLADIKLFANKKIVKGFTTNPSLLKKEKIKNFKNFVNECLKYIKNKSISFEITKDNFNEIYIQSKKISNLGKNVSVKIPILNSKGKNNIGLIKKIYNEKIKLNITAVFTKKQIDDLYKNINGKYEIIISIFAGRIADTGKDPEKLIKYALKKRKSKKIKILWASTREVYNIYQANRLNVDIITVTKDQINKLNLKNKNLHQYSIETSKQFFNDAKKAKIKI